MTKRLVQLCFLLLVMPLWLLYLLDILVVGRDAAFTSFSQLLSLVPGCVGRFLRAAFYRLTLRRCSQDCSIEFMTTFVTPDTYIGEHVYIGSGCNISLCDIGDDCLFGSGVFVMSGKGQHVFESADMPIRLQGGARQRVHIGPDCWLGNGAMIMADVGRGAVVAAGSVVTKPVESFSIVGGNPAKVIGKRK